MNSVYYYCRLFVWQLLLTILLKFNPIVVAALKNQVINLTYFDYYGQEIDEYCFCFSFYYLINQKKILKFFFLNKVNIIICQDYALVLEIFTLVEEILIA